MRFIAVLLILLCCGCQSPFEKDKLKLEKDIVILELKVRKAKLTNALEHFENKSLIPE